MQPINTYLPDGYGSFAAAACIAAIAHPTLLPVVAKASPRAEPVVLLNEGKIQACGVSVTFGDGSGKRFELLIRRQGEQSLLAVRANASPEITKVGGTPEAASANKIVVCRPTLETRSKSTRSLMQGEPTQREGFIELRTPARDDEIAGMIQELMISGGEFSCENESEESPTFALKGPLPQQVRAAYLNCSGDLFRPEEER